jgi:hypothetical protein
MVQYVTVSLGFLAVAAACTRPAWGGEPTRAEALFREARQNLTEGNYSAACPKLEESQRLDPATGTLFNLARCYELAGRLATAWTAYIDVAEQTHRDAQHQREAAARERIAALESRLSFLVVRLTEPLPASIHLLLDGKDMPLARAGVAVPIDAGEHALRASAPGKRDWDARFRVEGDTQRVELLVPALDDVATPPSRGSELPAPPAAVSEHAHGWSGQRTMAAVLGGAAIVAAGAGTYLGIEEIRLVDRTRDARNKTDWQAAHDSAIEAGNWSTGVFIGSGVLVAAAGLLWFTAQRPDRTSGSLLLPTVTPTSAGVMAIQRW